MSFANPAALLWAALAIPIVIFYILKIRLRRVPVSNQSDEPVECRLELDLNDNVVDVVPLKLAAGGQWSQTFEKTSAEGGRLIAKLNHADALPADNTAWALLPRRELQPVTLVTEGNLFLQKVFEANPLVKLSVVKELKGGTDAKRQAAATPSANALTVFHRTVPAQLPPGPVFVIDPEGPCDLWEMGEKLTNPLVTKQEKDSLLMAHVRLDNVLMPEARRLTMQPAANVLVLAAALGGEPIFAAINRPPPENLIANAAAESLTAGFGTRPIWYYLIAVAWLLAAVEWFLYQRRWIS